MRHLNAPSLTESCWMLLSLRNPSPALGVELNTLLLQGVQTMDRYPRPLRPQSHSSPMPVTLPPFPTSRLVIPQFWFGPVILHQELVVVWFPVGVCFFEPLLVCLWSSLSLLHLRNCIEAVSYLFCLFITLELISFVDTFYVLFIYDDETKLCNSDRLV